eukprot:8746644-Pyramimonas_sp.AAC.1
MIFQLGQEIHIAHVLTKNRLPMDSQGFASFIGRGTGAPIRADAVPQGDSLLKRPPGFLTALQPCSHARLQVMPFLL